jgi:hypothetical protein
MAGFLREASLFAPARLNVMVETFYTGLLILCSGAITWFASRAVYKLFKGQS